MPPSPAEPYVRAHAAPPLERAAWAVAAVVLVAHVAANAWSPYGVHRDEFLYMAMGEHLRLWRMDFPPFIALLSRATRALFGDSLVSLRLGPALAGAALVASAAGIARELGGRRTAQLLAALAVALAPVFMRPGNLFQPVVFDQLWWTFALWALLVLRRTGDRRWWLAVGAALGVGLLTKFSVAFIALGIAAAALLAHHRRDLLTPWPWAGALVALLLGSPSLVGQLRLDFPIRWQMRDLQAGQLDRLTPLDFLAGQPLLVGPALLLAALGVTWLVAGPLRARTREAGLAVAIAWLLLALGRGKNYYGAPVYPLLFAAGAVALERVERPRLRRGLVAATAAGVVAYGLVALPLGLPVVPPGPMARYARALGIAEATRTNYGTSLPLPQDYADMLGWPQMVADVARVWRALPPERRARAVLVGDNYGEAGALDFYGPRHGLPRAVSADGSYWFFGPGRLPGETVVALGGTVEGISPFFERCTLAGTTGTPWMVEGQQRTQIVLCERPREPLQAIWPRVHPELAD